MRVAREVLARTAVAALLAALLGGCTAVRIAYNNADTLVRYMAADYVYLEPPQKDDFNARLDRFHDWHRARELPAYAALLAEASRRMEKGIAEADVDWAAAELRVRYRLLAAQAATEAAPVLVSLSPEQVSDMERKLAEANVKYAREHYLDDQGRRHRRDAKQLRTRFDDWLGSLTDAQEERIDRFVREHDALAMLRFEDRKRRQREGVALIRAERDPTLLAPRLAGLFAHPEEGRPTEHRTAFARYDDALARLVVEIDRGATPDQRLRAVRRMAAYAHDFQVLAGQRAGAKAP